MSIYVIYGFPRTYWRFSINLMQVGIYHEWDFDINNTLDNTLFILQRTWRCKVAFAMNENSPSIMQDR